MPEPFDLQRNLADTVDQFRPFGTEQEQLVGHGLVKLCPPKAPFIWRGRAETLSPVGRIAEAIDVLGLSVEGKRNQPLTHPILGKNAPYGSPVRVEIPFSNRLRLCPAYSY